MDAALAYELGLEINRSRKLTLESEAPICKNWALKRSSISSEALGDRTGHGSGCSRKEKILSHTGLRPGDEEYRSDVMENSCTGGELGFAGAIEEIGNSQTWGDQRMADDLVPVVSESEFGKDAGRWRPTVLRIRAELGVIGGGGRGSGEEGVAGARRGRDEATGCRQSSISLLQVSDGPAQEAGIVAEAVDVCAEF